MKQTDIQDIVPKESYIHRVVATKVKRVIIVLPKGVKGKRIKYVDWNGKYKCGVGFVFINATDQREQFISSKNGVFIGHEGMCPQGINNRMILRSEAIKKYLDANPNALNEEHIEKTIKFMQSKVFRHAKTDVTQWDEKQPPDLWSSDIKWLKKMFAPQDIYDDKGNLHTVISASKKINVEYDAVYLGPNIKITGIGKTGKNGSWLIRKIGGAMSLCTEEVFKQTYKFTTIKFLFSKFWHKKR